MKCISLVLGVIVFLLQGIMKAIFREISTLSCHVGSWSHVDARENMTNKFPRSKRIMKWCIYFKW